MNTEINEFSDLTEMPRCAIIVTAFSATAMFYIWLFHALLGDQASQGSIGFAAIIGALIGFFVSAALGAKPSEA